jgi:hypothetical protein
LHKLLSVIAALVVACTVGARSVATEANVVGTIAEVVPGTLLADALTARERYLNQIHNLGRLTIIDYTRPSNERRMYVVDLEHDRAEALLVAHGKGSDPDNDGIADQFSDIMNSKMTSIGAFVTGEAYNGRFGRALRLHGLETTNASAYARAIVIHGASYVSPGRNILGRSWGCPAIDVELAERVIAAIADGTFLYAVG